MSEEEARQHLATPPAPNIMGQDRMRIIERRWVKPAPPSNTPPFEVVTTSQWEIF